MRRVACITLIACAIVYGAFLLVWYPLTFIVSVFCYFADPVVERAYLLGYFGFPIIGVAAMFGAWSLYLRSAYRIAIACGVIPPLLHAAYLVILFVTQQVKECL